MLSSPSKREAYSCPKNFLNVPADTDRQSHIYSNLSFSLGYDLYEQTYYQNLIKFSPTFAMLFSELDSLES